MAVEPARGPNETLIGVQGSRHMLGTPALVLDLDRLEANIASMAEHADKHGYALRPVAKIHKSTEIARRQAAAGAIGTCCATLAEAEVMADAGIAGVLLFTSVVTEPKLERLADLNARATRLSVATDDAGNVDALASAARRSGRPLEVLVDVEVGGGRTGAATPEAAVALARHIADADGLLYAGVQGYNGNQQNVLDYDQRRRWQHGVTEQIRRYVDALHRADLPPRIVSGGGTGSHDFDHELGVLTEVQTGTYVFLDGNYRDVVLRREDPHPFQPSLTVRTTVVSNAQEGFVITDGGAKELNGIFTEFPPPILRGAPDGSRYSLVGDDMGRIDLPEGAKRPPIGHIVEVVPPHCYQTAIMFSAYHVVRGDDLVDIWPLDAFPNW